MPNDCPYCGKPHFNFGDDEEGVEMWINEPNDGEHVIVVDPPYAWSIPINYCPFCGRKLEKVRPDCRPNRPPDHYAPWQVQDQVRQETPCCEVCGYSIGDMRWNHCPKCGAAIVDD